MTQTKPDICDVFMKGVSNNIHDEVTRRIVEPIMVKIKTEIEAVVRSEVEKYSIDSIERVKDLMNMSEKLGVIIHYQNYTRIVEKDKL